MLIDVSGSQLTRVANNDSLLIEEIALDMAWQGKELTFEKEGGDYGYAHFTDTQNIPLEAWTGDEAGVHLNPAEAYILGQTQALIAFAYCPEYEETVEVHFYSDKAEAWHAWCEYVNKHITESKDAIFIRR